MNKKTLLALTLLCANHMNSPLVTTSNETVTFEHDGKTDTVTGHVISSLNGQSSFCETQLIYLEKHRLKKPRFIPLGTLGELEIQALKEIHWDKWVYTSLYDIQHPDPENSNYYPIGAIILGTTNRNIVKHLFTWAHKATQKSKL